MSEEKEEQKMTETPEEEAPKEAAPEQEEAPKEVLSKKMMTHIARVSSLELKN